MNYTFPTIEHIDQVKEAIAGRPEFIIAQREGYQVVNYTHSTPDTFPAVTNEATALLRECRGLIFDDKGKVLSRRYHKFFNLGEKEETFADTVDVCMSHDVFEKLDGSMISPIVLDGGVFWTTKMGITDVANQVVPFVKEKPQYEMLAYDMHDAKVTPIFEWCSRQNRIVVDHPKDKLVLTALRDNETGMYFPPSSIRARAVEYGVEYIKPINETVHDLRKYAESINGFDGEGVVIRFLDGHMIKIKTSWYCALHKAKENLIHEKNVIALLLDEKMDDLLGFLMEEDKARLVDYALAFWKGLDTKVAYYETAIQTLSKHCDGDRKRFALELMPAIEDPLLVQLFFAKLQGRDVREYVIQTIRKNLGSQTQVDNIRYVWLGRKWEY